MQLTALAQELRARLHAAGDVAPSVLDATDDEALIDAYITCACCGERQVSRRLLPHIIALVHSADEFLEVCERLGQRPGARHA